MYAASRQPSDVKLNNAQGDAAASPILFVMIDFYDVPTFSQAGSQRPVWVHVPASRSAANRTLLLAALANGESLLRDFPVMDDTQDMRDALSALGIGITECPEGLRVQGCSGHWPNRQAALSSGRSGTAARFLTAALALSEGEYTLDADEQMRRRPMLSLLNALRSTGAQIEPLHEGSSFPLRITGRGRSDIPLRMQIDIKESSQYLSALLLAAGALQQSVEIVSSGLHGTDFVDMTLRTMAGFGVSVLKKECAEHTVYSLDAAAGYSPGVYKIEADLLSACYFFALAAMLGTSVGVYGTSLDCKHPGIAFLSILSRMGCTYEQSSNGILFHGPENGHLRGGFSADLSSCADHALTLAALASFADAAVTMTGIAHIRAQESDRILNILQNLAALGGHAEEAEGNVIVFPAKLHGGIVDPMDDHRAAMAFSLIGTRIAGVRIQDPSCCAKTFPNFFEVLDDVLFQLSIT